MSVNAIRQNSKLKFLMLFPSTGYTLWRQYLDELDPKVAELVDKHTYECLKARNMAV